MIKENKSGPRLLQDWGIIAPYKATSTLVPAK